MISSLKVSLAGKEIGYVAIDPNNKNIVFRYADRMAGQDRIQPAPIMMPTGSEGYTFPELWKGTSSQGLPGLLRDSVPDDYGISVITKYFALKGVSAHEITPLEILAYLGKRGFGALEFKPEEGPTNAQDVNIEIFELWNQSREILKAQTGADTSQPVDLVYQFGSTAGGARPKATVLYNEKTTDFMIQSKESIQKGFFPWLIKFDGFSGKTDTNKTPQPYERMEYIYSLMANDAGIKVPKTSYFEENGGLFHFLVKRFDRDLEPEYNSPNIFKIKKYHLQTLSALLHNDHNNQRSLDYDIALRYCLAITCDQSQVVEAYRRMVFNVLSHNRDDHSKNHSYIMNSNGQWSLSPSYDNVFCSPEATWFSKGHQITVNGKATDISFKDLEEIAKKHNVDSYRDLIDQVADAVSGWRNYAKKYLPGFDDYTNYVENRLKNVRVK